MSPPQALDARLPPDHDQETIRLVHLPRPKRERRPPARRHRRMPLSERRAARAQAGPQLRETDSGSAPIACCPSQLPANQRAFVIRRNVACYVFLGDYYVARRSSWASHAFAARQSRSIVASDTSSNAAVSVMSSPPKNRLSTIMA